jgi:peptide/nickel transport system substrate-binding protein
MHSRYSRFKQAISRTALIAIVVVVIVVIALGAYEAVLITSHSTSSTTTTSSTSSTTSSTTSTGITNTGVPSTFTYYTAGAINYLDPQVSYYSYDYNIIQNVYEPLLWFNGANGTQLIPWLASNYTTSNGGHTWTINLRQGITFQDGEQFNSTAVYFTLNRVLIDDSSQVNNHNAGPGWILEQALNHSLSSVLTGPHAYSQQWASEVLAQNFVQITGPYSVQLNVMNPDAAFAYWLGIASSSIVAPDWVMQHDIALWTTNSYTLPNPTLSGNATQVMGQYFHDFVSTCDTGATPKGCGQTSLDFPSSGAMAGTGPYILSSFSQSTNNIVLTANSKYWGGAYQFMSGAKEVPQIKTIDIDYVPDPTTAFVDLQNAAKSGQAAAADIASTTFYNVVNRAPWLANGTLESIVPGISLYGPYTTYSTFFDPFEMNVTNPQTGNFYTFQPFADQRIRLAFADSVNMTEQNIDVNNRQGSVANGLIPPGLPPAGAYNASLTPAYSYNPDAAAQLLLQAMETPITHFTFTNGSAAPAGLFNNTFGCPTLPSSGTCAHPVSQSINLVYSTGDALDGSIMTTIASTINNISVTYNMGLTVNVQPVPSGQMLTEAFGSQLYMYALGWIDDYPWVNDFLGAMYGPGGSYPGPDGWNITAMGNYWTQAQVASSSDNITGLLKVTQDMNELANNGVMYLWTTHTYGMLAMTSNVRGEQFNPSLSTAAGANAGPELFVLLY